ncbi:hypothetical protein [Secundilactobacillus yichangensis]|uniref:hypothetical protein n=1 Tax=Secundilactobacillus yichangensis TaxID=2799580 RepID=UPI0019405BC9|nr:hypothetical protein [Secundilactobacillus yichangensis]
MSFDRKPEVRAEIEKLTHTRIVAGVPLHDSYLQMIAGVNENGAVITAKRQWLTIPTAAAGTRKASEISGLFKPKGKNILAVDNGGELTVMFILKKSVKIPPRPFIWTTREKNRAKYARMMREGVIEIIHGKSTADILQHKLARTMTNDIRITLRDFFDPANAPLTVERKGKNDPLMDTGKLIGSITWTFLGSGE